MIICKRWAAERSESSHFGPLLGLTVRESRPQRLRFGKSGMTFVRELTVSYSFKETSDSAFSFILQNVSKPKKCQLPTEKEHKTRIYPCMHPPTVMGCVCARTNLAPSVDVEQTHPTSQLLSILDAVPQNTGGEIKGALIGLQRREQEQHTNTLTSWSHFYSYNSSDNMST